MTTTPSSKEERTRGYWGVAFFEPKFEENIGTAIRSAHCFGADFIALIGKRFTKTPANTMATERHIPIYEYKDLKDFMSHLPVGCEVVVVECDGEDIKDFKHPQRAVYLIGGEDRNVPSVKAQRVRFPTSHCVNMAMAATLISYDRKIK